MASMHRAAQTRQSCTHISLQSMDVDALCHSKFSTHVSMSVVRGICEYMNMRQVPKSQVMVHFKSIFALS